MTIARIQRIYSRHYRDNGRTVYYAEWIDHKGRRGRTESPGEEPSEGSHMHALFSRGLAEGLPIEHEEW